jgi:acetyl-CoA carboxylase biotin carboxyl carrier protein
VDAVRASDVSEFTLEHGDFRVRVKRATTDTPNASLVWTGPATTDTVALADPLAGLHRVVAPLTGIFYRAPSPSARPYVVEGDWVQADAVIGLIETMKVFNEVSADRSGRVVAFLAEPGQLVQANDPLVAVEPGSREPAEPERSV